MRRALLLLLLGALLAGCGGASTAGSATGAPSGGAATVGGGDGALYGELTTVDGDQLDGAAYRNADLALWFWAPW